MCLPVCFFVPFSRCWFLVTLRVHKQHWEIMAGKGRKHHQPTEDTQEVEVSVGSEERGFLELFITSQAKRDEESIERARKEQLAAEERAEQRRIRAEIAAEEREEKRKERAKIAEEERAEARALQKEKRKREEAERLEELALKKEEALKEKEEAASRAAERLAEKTAELQEEAAKKAYEQQKALLELQADLGKRAAETSKLESDKSRQRDRVISSLPTYLKGEDVEDFLLATERKLRLGEIPEGEWLALVAAKLNGEVGASWQELCMVEKDYQVVRASLLTGCGYTPRAAGEAYHSFRFEHLKGMAGDQVYRKGCQLLKRMVAPMVLTKEMLFRLVKPWVYACIGRRARAVLDARVVEDAESLVRGLQDYLASEGDKVSGKTAVFGSDNSSGRRQPYSADPEKKERKQGVSGGNGSSGMKCFRCGKLGHKAADCWQGSAGGKQGESVNPKIVCFICGVEGHKATTCPTRKEGQKGSGPKQVKQVLVKEEGDTFVSGKMNGKGVSLLLDSGAHITIVPEEMVTADLKTGEVVAVKGFRSSTTMKLPTARVVFEVEGMEKWEETVALTPAEPGKETEVLYGLKIRTPRGLDLVILASRQEEAEVSVRRVTTRAEAKKEEAERKENARVVALEQPNVKAVDTVAGKEDSAEVTSAGKPSTSTMRKKKVCVSRKGPGEGGLVADRPASNPEPVAQMAEQAGANVSGPVLEEGTDRSTGNGGPAADRPVGNPEPVSLSMSGEMDEWPDFCEEVDSEEEEVEVPGEDRDVPLEDLQYSLRKGGEVEDLGVPPVKKGPGSRAKLVAEVKSDSTLEGYRALAEKGEQGFQWRDGLLFQARMDQGEEVVHALVLPKSFRKRVLEMAHEGTGHMGARKVKALLRHRFVWPGMGVEVIEHTRSCEVCQRCAKAKSRKAPLMEREVLSEPFEVLAIDLVGPMPTAKYGFRYVLTAVCMGSKWPEAIPLKTETAKAVAHGLMEIFARTGIPLQLLSDQGSQFRGSLVTQLCRDLRIDQIQSAPYHPECNGVVERMHGTLVPMLTKAHQLGLDWVEQLPFALFALRSAPNRDTAFSPYQLVYGHRVRTPLDILYEGWAEVEFGELETEEWADWLVERLAVWHELVRERGKKASGDRKSQYDKTTVDRTLEVGDQVLCRIPGVSKKLKEAWHGPYKVVARKSRVDYLVNLGKGKGRVKTLHINNLKRYYPRVEEILRVALVAEDWADDEAVGTTLKGAFEGFEEEAVVRELRSDFPEVFSDLPGKATVCQLRIDTGDAVPRRSHPYRVPDRLKEGVRKEVNKLVELGIVVPSTSPWASPVVPVPKSDGTVRVCVDYRKLNQVTTADPYYMSTMDEILERVGSSKIISKIDLAKGFYQVEVEPESQEKTAFVSPYGKYHFTRMPFGLKNAPAMFQRLMEVVLGDCSGCSAPYIDDVVVFSESAEEHVRHLRCVLGALRRYGLTIKEKKCEWGKVRLEYLGHVIGGGELAVPAHRAAAMAEYKQPHTKRQLRSFLGAAGYYRQFVEGYARMTSVLTPLTAKNAPSVVNWTPEGLEAFTRIKVSLVDVACLTVPTQQDEFVLHCDASGSGIGATLNVLREGKKLPVAYYSKQLQGAQHHYSATELEGLALFRAVHFFAHYLYGCRFKVLTDHKALVSLLHSRVLNRRLHGWVLQLLEYDFEVEYRPGRENGDADALSRQAWDTRSGGPWMREGDGDLPGLRPAPSYVVGGDVGLETPQKTSGEATAGVALQGVKEAVCKNSRSVQDASTCRNMRAPAGT